MHAWRLAISPLLSLAALLAPIGARAGEGAPSERSADSVPPAGHSLHGEAFNDGPRQKAYIMTGTGRVSFPITTRSPAAQQFFEQGVGQLHGFWYFEAERSFRQAAALDPDCAMAYWGMAMANINNAKRARDFIQKATEKEHGIDRREAMWIDGLAAFHGIGPEAPKKDDQARRRDYVRSLEEIVQEYPADIEAKAFLALQIWMNSGAGLPIPSHQAVDALLDQVFAAEPMHPAHHYRIHLWDNEKAERAIRSAASSGQSAPAIAHMWHMGGHIFAKLHRYADSAWQQEASARVDHAHMIRDRVLPDQIHNYAHNQEWLIRNLMNLGRARDAINLARNLIELPRHPRYNTLDRGGSSARYGRVRLLEALVAFELWDEIIALAETVYLEPTGNHDLDVDRLWALGLARSGKGEVEAAKARLAELEALRSEQRTAREKAAGEAEEKARNENQPDDKIQAAMMEAMRPFRSRLRPIEDAIFEIEGQLALEEGRHQAAFERFQLVKDIPGERLARARLRAGDPGKAEEIAQKAVESHSQEVLPLAVLVEVLHRAGKQREAAAAFQELRAIAADADPDLPAFRRLAPLAAELGLGEDWRLRPAAADDAGVRPPLDSLGPFHWKPAPAPAFSLTDAGGRTVSLSDYRGRPLVLIFYLGAGCLHCVEQINKFAPMAGEFEKEGIALAAISSESLESLRKSLENPPEGVAFAFPFLSDDRLEIFKAYRAYDDFETLPLHGTFLIDAAGLVRWQDISYEPFQDVRFLLEESRRLLRQSGRSGGKLVNFPRGGRTARF